MSAPKATIIDFFGKSPGKSGAVIDINIGIILSTATNCDFLSAEGQGVINITGSYDLEDAYITLNNTHNTQTLVINSYASVKQKKTSTVAGLGRLNVFGIISNQGASNDYNVTVNGQGLNAAPVLNVYGGLNANQKENIFVNEDNVAKINLIRCVLLNEPGSGFNYIQKDVGVVSQDITINGVTGNNLAALGWVNLIEGVQIGATAGSFVNIPTLGL